MKKNTNFAGIMGKEITEATKRICAKVGALRAKRGFTQGEIAEKSGLFQASISRLEKGEISPSVDLLEWVLEPMGYTIDIVRREEVEE